MQGAGHGAFGAPTSIVGDSFKKLKRIEEILTKTSQLDVSRSHIVMFPVSIRGKHQDDKKEVPPFHITAKWLGDTPKKHMHEIHQSIEHIDKTPMQNFDIVPHHFDTPRGRVHVLLLKGPDTHKIHKIRGALYNSGETEQDKHEFIPHVTVTKEIHDEVKEKGLTAKDLGLKVHPLEYRIGHNTVHKYPETTPSAYPEMQPEIKKSDIVPQEQSKVPQANPMGDAVGKWFQGIYKDPSMGRMSTPRVKYLGMKGAEHHFQKEDGTTIKVSHGDMLSQKYHFEMHPDQDERLSGYKSPDYSDDKHLQRFNSEAHPYLGKEVTIKAKSHYDSFSGSHQKLKVIAPDGKDITSKLAAFQTKVHDVRHMGTHLSELSDNLWYQHGLKLKLHPSAKQHVDSSIPVESKPVEETKPEPKQIKKSVGYENIGLKLNYLRNRINADGSRK